MPCLLWRYCPFKSNIVCVYMYILYTYSADSTEESISIHTEIISELYNKIQMSYQKFHRVKYWNHRC